MCVAEHDDFDYQIASPSRLEPDGLLILSTGFALQDDSSMA